MYVCVRVCVRVCVCLCVCVLLRQHPAQHRPAGIHAQLPHGEEQRDAGVRPQPACGRQQPHRARAHAHSGQDRRRCRQAPPDFGGEEGLKTPPPLPLLTPFTLILFIISAPTSITIHANTQSALSLLFPAKGLCQK